MATSKTHPGPTLKVKAVPLESIMSYILAGVDLVSKCNNYMKGNQGYTIRAPFIKQPL